jgi:DNA repair exonuclease SbcCD nuclease subunit
MKFVHAADLHLDSPLRGLEAYEGAPVDRIREATRRAFRELIDLCLEEEAAFLLLAGDLFDGEWKDFNTGLFFVKELSRLSDADVRVLFVRGNHDAASEVTRRLELPAHVHAFSEDEAETIVLDRHGVAVHGLSFQRRAMPHSLVPRYPAPLPGMFNIGLLHTSADGRDGHGTYAPCRVQEMAQKGYQYWALGHVHAHEILERDPWIVFPGNLQARHIKETGPKGCVVVSVVDAEVTAVRHQPLDLVRFVQLAVELAEDDDFVAACDRVRAALAAEVARADGRMVAVRLTVTGASAAHAELVARPDQATNELKALTFEHPDDLWLESIRFHTRPPVSYDELRASEGFLGALLRASDTARSDDAALRVLGDKLSPMAERLGDELPASGLDLGDPVVLRELLAQAEHLLSQRLHEPGAGR